MKFPETNGSEYLTIHICTQFHDRVVSTINLNVYVVLEIFGKDVFAWYFGYLWF